MHQDAFFDLEAKSSGFPSTEQETINMVRELHKIELSNFRVVGGIVRYDESARNILKDTKQRIVTSLTSQARGRDNYLIWAPPGSGKSFFIQEIAKSLGDKISYTELNLAQMDEEKFRSALSKIEQANRPRLCFIDEVDSKSTEEWPYEALLPSLEPPDRNTIRTCFVLAGSGGNSLSEMKERMDQRPKGVDLLSRIPSRNESEIPGLALGDKLLVAATQFLRASNEKGRRTDEVEKLVLYYIALNPRLKSARQIRDLAIHCIERMPSGEERIKFDYLFDAGDPENKEFWNSASPMRNELVNTFVRLEDDQIVFRGPSPRLEASRIEENHMNQEIAHGKNRIAILPFSNISPDPKDEYFADGMTEELISAISLISELSVISRTSVMSYKNQQDKRTMDIGKELDVRTILEGSIRKAGNRVRISVQLIDVESDRHLWAQNYDRTLDDIFAIQSEIAVRVAESLEIQLLPEKRRRIENANTKNVDAHLLYLKGHQSFHNFTKDGFENAVKFFEMAIEKDPLYALAFASAAMSCVHLAINESSSREMFAKCKNFAERALSIDGSLAEAHLALGCALWGEWNFEVAEREIRRAIELNPNLGDSYYYLGWLLMWTVRIDEAITESERARELDPLSSYAWTVAGSAYLYTRRNYDKAIEYLEKAIKIDPLNALARANLGAAMVQKGMPQRGIEETSLAVELQAPSVDAVTEVVLAYACTKAGHKEKAVEVLSLLLEGAERNPSWAGSIAGVYSILGDKEKAFAWLEKGFQEHSGNLLWLGADFAYDNIRTDPKFDPLLVRIGLKKPSQIETNPMVFNVQRSKVGAEEKGSPTKLNAARIAVLPFANISPDPKDEYFADGMTEELISTLSKIRGLKVISRTSVLRYKQTTKSLSEIAKELNVGAVLEGSVRKAADDLRITAQLIDVENDEHLWSQDYNRKFENVFSLQAEIAQKVADSLQLTILAKENKEIGKKPTKNMEAYTLYLKGRSYRHRTTLDSYKRTIDYCEQAIQKDPNYAQAYAEIANCYAKIGTFELLPSNEGFLQAERFAEKAIQLDPSVPESHLALGQVLLYHKWDFRGAEIEIRRAIELSPNLVDGHLDLAGLLVAIRRFDEAVLECKRSLELDPLSASTCTWAGTWLTMSNRIDEAIEELRNAVELDPTNSAMAHDNLGYSYVMKGRIEEGISEIKVAGEIFGEIGIMQKNDLAYAYSRAGKMDEVRNILADLLRMREQGYVSEAAIGGVYLSLGEKDKSMEWLEKAYQQHSGYLVAINCEQTFNNLRSDPRFQALLKKIGFPDSG